VRTDGKALPHCGSMISIVRFYRERELEKTSGDQEVLDEKILRKSTS
jgi:hypothetical protein